MVSKVMSTVLTQSMDHPIEIEVHMSGGIPQINLVGLPDQAVKESKERLIVALAQQELMLPNKRFTVNFSPPDIRKQGSHLDLPIALGLMLASGKLQNSLSIGALGTINLMGEVNAFPMSFALVESLQHIELDVIIIPKSLLHLKLLYPHMCMIGISSLRELKYLMHGKSPAELMKISIKQMDEAKLQMGMAKDSLEISTDQDPNEDFIEVKGQELAKLALIYAVSGNHHMLLYGPPGTGKTMLARRIASIQPYLGQSECFELLRRKSINSGFDEDYRLRQKEPFRAPHHGCSQSAILGGMRANMIGEAALSHEGILFMDELPEFKRDVIEGLRGPIESGEINLSKAHYKQTLSARFTLIATANPCPCGYHGFSSKCICNERDIERYFSKISGPILDRFDMTVQVSYRESPSAMEDRLEHKPMDSKTMLEHVLRIRKLQEARYGNTSLRNGQLSIRDLATYCQMTEEANDWFTNHVSDDRFQNSYRRQYKIVKLARTIADFNDSEIIERSHIIEAFYYNRRQLIGSDLLKGGTLHE